MSFLWSSISNRIERLDPAILVCMAKTQYSFSHDASLKGVPTGQCQIFFWKFMPART